MDRNEFRNLLKDLMPHLQDFAVLETHPLTSKVAPEAGYKGSRGEYLQRLMHQAIEGLQPTVPNLSPKAVEWRPYQILKRRYIEGAGLQEISSELHLSERQVRRDHSRALKALEGRLWDQIFKDFDQTSRERVGETAQDQGYEVQAEILDLNEVLKGVAGILSKRLGEEEVELQLVLSKNEPQGLGDRVILRQILISLVNLALHLNAGKAIQIHTLSDGKIQIQFTADTHWDFWLQEERNESIKSVHYWSRRIQAELRESFPPKEQEGPAFFELSLPRSGQPTVLVVDDQKPTLRLYQRYLNRSGIKVVGVSDPKEVMRMARQLRPVLITLDVMMPQTDGWEILQALQLDADIRNIPVIVCSAWEEPELAKSLGAAGFLKKPITRKDLLEALERLNLPV